MYHQYKLILHQKGFGIKDYSEKWNSYADKLQRMAPVKLSINMRNAATELNFYYVPTVEDMNQLNMQLLPDSHLATINVLLLNPEFDKDKLLSRGRQLNITKVDGKFNTENNLISTRTLFIYEIADNFLARLDQFADDIKACKNIRDELLNDLSEAGKIMNASGLSVASLLDKNVITNTSTTFKEVCVRIINKIDELALKPSDLF